MKNQLILYQADHKKNLLEYCNKRSKKTKISKNPTTYLRQTLYLLNPIMKSAHNAAPYFLTIAFPKSKQPILNQWEDAVKWIQNFKQEISKDFLVIAGIISIEPHKNTSLKSKTGQNSKAGSPHFHMVIWISHDFLNPEIEFLKRSFNRSHVLAKINQLKTDVDTIKAILYTMKEKDCEVLQNLCKDFTQWTSNINIWINHVDVKESFQEVNFASDNLFFESQECYSWLPTTRYHRDKALLLAELFTKIFRLKNLAVKDGFVYERTENTQFSWTRRMPLQTWIANTFSEKAPVNYLAMLKENAYWVATQGKTFKTGIDYELFPKLKIQFFLVEFLDKVYEFKYGKTFTFDEIDFEINSICYLPVNFNEIKPPIITLSLLFVLLNYGKDQAILAHMQQEIPPLENASDINIKDAKDFKLACEKLQIALTAIGGLYHFDVHRKHNKTIYFTGEPNTFKTTIFKALLDKLIGLPHVDVISRNNSKFNLGNLRKQDDAPYLLIMDDLRWENLGLQLPEFLNLLDGTFVNTEQKYMQGVAGKLQGNLAITSNQRLDQDSRDYQDTKALKARMTEVVLHPIRGEIFKNENLVELLEQEAIAFSILTNMIFLKYKCNTSNLNLDIPTSFFKTEIQPQSQNQKIGLFLFKKIMHFFK